MSSKTASTLTRLTGLPSLYRAGARKDGWCCIDCHATFDNRRGPRREFVSLLLHKVVRHHRVPTLVPGRACHVAHSDQPFAGYVWHNGNSTNYTITFIGGKTNGTVGGGVA